MFSILNHKFHLLFIFSGSLLHKIHYNHFRHNHNFYCCILIGIFHLQLKKFYNFHYKNHLYNHLSHIGIQDLNTLDHKYYFQLNSKSNFNCIKRFSDPHKLWLLLPLLFLTMIRCYFFNIIHNPLLNILHILFCLIIRLVCIFLCNFWVIFCRWKYLDIKYFYIKLCKEMFLLFLPNNLHNRFNYEIYSFFLIIIKLKSFIFQ